MPQGFQVASPTAGGGRRLGGDLASTFFLEGGNERKRGLLQKRVLYNLGSAR